MGRRLDLLKARLLEWRAKVNQKASIKSRVLEIRARRRLDENLENAKGEGGNRKGTGSRFSPGGGSSRGAVKGVEEKSQETEEKARALAKPGV